MPALVVYCHRIAKTIKPIHGGNGSAMRKHLFSVLIAALLLSVASAAMGAPADQAANYYSQRKDISNVIKGIEFVENQLKAKGEDYELLWMQARFYWYLGDRSEGKDRVVNFEKAKAYAERAVAANEDGIDGHYWLAASIGSTGIEKGILNSLFMVAPMKKELEKCFKIDPRHAGSHYLMARLLWQVPSIAGGNVKKALEEAKLAVEYDPGDSSHWLALGQIAAANKDYKLARSSYEHVISMPDDKEDPASSQSDKDMAKAELKKIEGK